MYNDKFMQKCRTNKLIEPRNRAGRILRIGFVDMILPYFGIIRSPTKHIFCTKQYRNTSASEFDAIPYIRHKMWNAYTHENTMARARARAECERAY